MPAAFTTAAHVVLASVLEQLATPPATDTFTEHIHDELLLVQALFEPDYVYVSEALADHQPLFDPVLYARLVAQCAQLGYKVEE